MLHVSTEAVDFRQQWEPKLKETPPLLLRQAALSIMQYGLLGDALIPVLAA